MSDLLTSIFKANEKIDKLKKENDIYDPSFISTKEKESLDFILWTHLKDCLFCLDLGIDKEKIETNITIDEKKKEVIDFFEIKAWDFSKSKKSCKKCYGRGYYAYIPVTRIPLVCNCVIKQEVKDFEENFKLTDKRI